jgi:methyl-accepting chemotaxis protein
MKISQQLKCAAIGVLAIGSSSALSVHLNSVGNDSKVVNLTGIVRGGSQRLVKLELAGQSSDRLIAKQDRLINGLIHGDPSLELPVAKDPGFREQMQTVSSVWVNLKQQILDNRADGKYKPELLAASENFFELADRAVSSAEQYANIKIQRLRMIQLAIFGSSLLLSIVLLMTINKITSSLEGSIDNISVSAETIAAVLVSQGKSIGLQVITVDTATQIVRGLQDFTQQSSTTAQMSVDLIDRTLESIQQIARFTRQNSVEMYSLHGKLSTISDRIALINGQNAKIASMATQTYIPDRHKSSTAYVVEQDRIIHQQLNNLSANLGASIAAMMTLTDESLKSISAEIESAKQNTINLCQTTDAINSLSVNDRQISLAVKQNANAVKQLTVSIEELSLRAQDSATSIAAVGMNATKLGEISQTLKSRI